LGHHSPTVTACPSYPSPLRFPSFAGAGGLALAASHAGFEHDAVLEYNHDACENIRSNQRRGYELVRHWPLIEGDVHDQDFQTWNGRVDMVSGGPPCQPFSIGGKHGAMGDRRNPFPEAAPAVREIQPRAFVFENVKGLLRESFEKRGCLNFAFVLSSRRFGYPKREY
jgi:DNA (cytosine-5)-methyltransferase 1